MGVTYDPKANAAYLSLVEDGKVSKTVEVTGSVLLDLDEKGTPLGVELLYPARQLPLNELQRHLSAEQLKATRELWQQLRNVLNEIANRARG